MNCKVCASTFTRMKDLIHHAIREKLKSQHVQFSCISCSMLFDNIPELTQHVESIEHSIMALATGIYFETETGDLSNVRATFPPHSCCLLCGSRNLSSSSNHLRRPGHKYFVSLMKEVFTSKKIQCVAMPTNFVSKLIDVRQREFIPDSPKREVFFNSSQLFCELCNIYFTKSEHYAQHLQDQSHKRIEQFMIKISIVVKEMDVVDEEAINVKVVKTFSNSLMPLFYCEICCIWIDSFINYDQHTNGISHRKIGELLRKLCKIRNGEAVSLRDFASGAGVSYFSPHYCTLCSSGFSSAERYRSHLTTVGHLRIDKFVNSLPSKHDKKFINVYIDAQAHLKFNKSPPKNYCELCDNLYSKSEKYICHLQSKEHRQSKKYYLKIKNDNDEYFEEKSFSFRPLENDAQMPGKMINRKRKNVYCEDDYYPRPRFPDTITRFSPLLHPEIDRHSNIGPIFESYQISNSRIDHEAVNPKDSYPRQFGFEIGDTSSNPYPLFDSKNAKLNGNLQDFKSNESNIDSNSQVHYCEICEFMSYNSLHYEKHLTGEQHKKLRRMLNKRGKESCFDLHVSEASNVAHPLQYNCELCDVFNHNSQEYEFHVNNAKHKRNQWLLYVFKQKSL